MRLLTRLQTKFKQLVFLEKFPEAGEVVLKQRRVFTLPTSAGLLYSLMLIVLFLTATNYNLNLGFGMTYLLIGVAVINTFSTFRNLAYLRLNASAQAPVFAGEAAQFTLHLDNPQSLDRYAIHIGFMRKGKTQLPEQTVDIGKQDLVTVNMSLTSTQRGYLAIERIRLRTSYPLGLLRAWSTWLPDVQVLVYPRPEAFPPPLPFSGDSQTEVQHSTGDEDFAGVRSYHEGDPLKHLSWKHIARVDLDAGGNLISKQFSGGSGGEVVLDFSKLSPQLGLELRLARMTSWVLEADRKGFSYAFTLGSINYPAANGANHRLQCLSALALYGIEPSSSTDKLKKRKQP